MSWMLDVRWPYQKLGHTVMRRCPKVGTTKVRRQMGQGGGGRRHIMRYVTRGGLLRPLTSCCSRDLNYSPSRVSSLGARTICTAFTTW